MDEKIDMSLKDIIGKGGNGKSTNIKGKFEFKKRRDFNRNIDNRRFERKANRFNKFSKVNYIQDDNRHYSDYNENLIPSGKLIKITHLHKSINNDDLRVRYLLIN